MACSSARRASCANQAPGLQTLSGPGTSPPTAPGGPAEFQPATHAAPTVAAPVPVSLHPERASVAGSSDGSRELVPGQVSGRSQEDADMRWPAQASPCRGAAAARQGLRQQSVVMKNRLDACWRVRAAGLSSAPTVPHLKASEEALSQYEQRRFFSAAIALALNAPTALLLTFPTAAVSFSRRRKQLRGNLVYPALRHLQPLLLPHPHVMAPTPVPSLPRRALRHQKAAAARVRASRDRRARIGVTLRSFKMEAKNQLPESAEEAEKTQQNDPDQAVAAEAGKEQPLEPVVAEIEKDQPVESRVAGAGRGERLETLGAKAGDQEPVETVAAKAEETAERQDDPGTSYVATEAPALERPEMSRVGARGPIPKHPLHDRWSLWYYQKNRHRSWEDNLMEVTSFDSLDDFWRLHMHIEPASNLRRGCDYALFRHGIEPSWEDVRNKNGGHWLFAVDRSRRNLNDDWLEVLLCLVEEAFGEHSADVCGAVVQVRTGGDKIAVWTTDSSREVANMVIGRTLKERLKLHPLSVIPYRSHADIVQTEDGAEIKAKYTA